MPEPYNTEELNRICKNCGFVFGHHRVDEACPTPETAATLDKDMWTNIDKETGWGTTFFEEKTNEC